MTPLDRSHTSSYSSSIVTVVISCIVSEITRDIGRKSRFFVPLVHIDPWKIIANIFALFLHNRVRWLSYNVQKSSILWLGCTNETDDNAMTIAERNVLTFG